MRLQSRLFFSLKWYIQNMYISGPIMENFKNYFKNGKIMETCAKMRTEVETVDLEGKIHDRFMIE